MSSDKVSELIPFVFVSDVGGSIEFYENLGFSLRDAHDHDGRLDWAALENVDAKIMLTRSHGAIDPGSQAVLLYLYVDDLDGFRDRLVSLGISVREIRDGSPGPERELALCDPDGHRLLVAEN